MAIEKELLDKLLAEYQKPEDIIGENGLLKELRKQLRAPAMSAELSGHLGFAKHDPAGHNSGNTRNGVMKKTLKGDFGEMELETPRDRKGTFAPKIVAKGQTRFTGFDDKIVSMYARGMTTRDIEAHLAGDLRSGRVAGSDLQRHRSGDGGSEDLAGPVAGRGIPDPLYGRVAGEGAGRRACGEQGHLRGDRGEHRRQEGGAGAVGGTERGRQVLVAGLDGDTEPGSKG